MKFSKRLALGFGIMVLLILATAGVGLVAATRLNTQIGSLVDEKYPVTIALGAVRSAATDNAVDMQGLLLVTDADQMQQDIARIERAEQGAASQLAKLDKQVADADGRMQLERIGQARTAFAKDRKYFIDQIRSGANLELVKSQLQVAKGSYNAYIGVLDQVVIYQGSQFAAASQAAADEVRLARFILFIVGGVGVALAVGIGALTVRSLMRQLGAEPDYAKEIVERVAGGDLQVAVATRPGDDSSLLHAMAVMQSQLREIIGRFNAGAANVATASAGMVETAAQVTQVSERQGELAAATAAAVEQLSVSINQVADNARNTEANSRQANELSTEGQTLAHTASEEMGRIADNVAASSRQIEALLARSEDVGGIVKVIQEIADQTNLLALNAAIEAARAGEQGRGFAVVADEVRKLAERTTQATTRITGMITAIQDETRAAVGGMRTSTALVHSGLQFADRAAESLRQISSGTRDTLEKIREVAAATREQGAASQSIARNVEDMARMTEQGSAAVRQSADAARRLDQLALDLKGAAQRFRV